MDDLHQIQLEILRKLLFNPEAKFSDLIFKETNTMLHSYHLNVLIKAKYIRKESGTYRLTSKGKEYANRLDTEQPLARIEKSPKISVACHIFNGKDYDSDMLVQTRLKEPFYGYMGGITGKAKFGETAMETATREILEESGLSGNLHYHGIAHFINYYNEQLVEDKYFLVYSMLNARGTLITEGEGFKNQWMSLDKYRHMSPVYDGELELIEMCINESGNGFLEFVNHLEEF